MRKFEYWVRIVLFGLTIQIPNTKYRIVLKMLKKRPLKSTYLSHTRHFVFKICETICTSDRYSIIQKKRIPNIEYYSVFRYSEYQIRILLFGLIIQIFFEYRIIHHTLALDTPPSFVNKLTEGLTLSCLSFKAPPCPNR